MPGFTIRGTGIFEQRNRGWTESYFFQRVNADLAAASTDFEVLMQKRAALLGKQSQIKARRVSVEFNDATPPVKVRGDAKLLKTPVYLGNATEDSDFSDMAVILRRENAGSTRHSNMPLRGVWDSIVATGGIYNRTQPGWSTAMDNYRAGYLALGCGWIGEQTQAQANAINSTTTAAGIVSVQVDDAIFTGIPAGTRVLMSFSGINAPDGSPLNGRQVMQVVDTVTVRTTTPLAMLPITVHGIARLLQPAFIATNSIQDESIGERKTGSPLLESPGRRRKKARA